MCIVFYVKTICSGTLCFVIVGLPGRVHPSLTSWGLNLGLPKAFVQVYLMAMMMLTFELVAASSMLVSKNRGRCSPKVGLLICSMILGAGGVRVVLIQLRNLL